MVGEGAEEIGVDASDCAFFEIQSCFDGLHVDDRRQVHVQRVDLDLTDEDWTQRTFCGRLR